MCGLHFSQRKELRAVNLSQLANSMRFDNRDILLGHREIANTPMPDGSRFCLHEDLDAAISTIGKLREAVGEYGMHIAMAHDAEFIKEGTDPLLMSLLHPLFDEKCLARIREHQRP